MLRTVYYSIPLFVVIFAHAHAVVPRPFPPLLSKGLGTRLWNEASHPLACVYSFMLESMLQKEV
jgi:hypothetical protein